VSDDAAAGQSGHESDWETFDIEALVEKAASGRSPYHEFLRVPSLSCGIYRLAAGSRDMQGAHDEDEVYYVLSGRARLRVEGEDRVVGPGSVLYVRATSEHSFFEIEEDLTLLVFFASGGPSGAP
jgi:mannose-6-phosphate isomerase-like protein (cupin superfamily)